MVTQRRDLDALDADELMRRGVAAVRVGEADEARAYLTEITRREPDNADAWLWLAGVEQNPPVKREYFERVLELRPGDTEAQAGLERLAEKYGQAVLVREEDASTLTCTWHPDRETLLRCNRCGRPMCTACAVKHPVGLRCKECVRELRSPIYNITLARYLAAGVVGLAASTFAGLVLSLMGGFWFVALFVGAAAGAAIAEAVSLAAGRKRGRGLQIVTGVTMVLGVAAAGVVLAFPRGINAGSLVGALSLFLNPGVLIYLIIGVGAAASRLR